MEDRRGDEGFTLIELLVAMMIMLLITVPLVTSFVLGIQTTTGSKQDVINSTDAQLLSNYLDIDVANSDSVSPSGGCAGGSPVLVLSWTDAGAGTVIDYSLVADPTAKAELGLTTTVYRLERHRCASVGAAVLESTEVGHQLIAEGATAPAAVTCDGGACAAGSHPRLVTLRLQEASKMVTDKGSATVFSFGITATRKVTTP